MADIRALPFGLFQSVTYLIILEELVCLIDPSAPPDRLPPCLPPVGIILATHGHIDHIDQADRWRRSCPADLAIHAGDRDCLIDAGRNLSSLFGRPQTFLPAGQILQDGQRLALGRTHDLTVCHTPGHTAGSCCFLLSQDSRPIALFSGDTLFAGSIGRLDLGGDEKAMRHSLQKLARLSLEWIPVATEDLPVYPGHGPATALKREIAGNPYFRTW